MGPTAGQDVLEKRRSFAHVDNSNSNLRPVLVCGSGHINSSANSIFQRADTSAHVRLFIAPCPSKSYVFYPSQIRRAFL